MSHQDQHDICTTPRNLEDVFRFLLPCDLKETLRHGNAVIDAFTLAAVALADEPAGNLDQTTAAQVADLLLQLQADEQTMLIAVTHSTSLAGRMQQRQRLDNGRLEDVD